MEYELSFQSFLDNANDNTHHTILENVCQPQEQLQQQADFPVTVPYSCLYCTL